MTMQLLLVAFTVCIGLSSIQSRSEAGSDQHGIRENFRNLFNSINKNDMMQTDTYRNALEQEMAREKEAFDTMKEAWRYKRQRNFNEHRGLGRAAAVKREAEKPVDVSNGRPVNVGLVQECLEEMKLGDKTIDQLSPVQLGELKGKVDAKHAECGENDGRYDAVSYCNSYRKEVERFEALFKRLIADAPSFNTTLNTMVPVFQAEREAASGQKRMNFYGDLNRQNWFQKCTRVEKWRVILTWFSLLMSDSGSCMSAAIEEQNPLLEVLRNSLENLKEEVEKDFETFIKGGIRYRAAENLPFHFKKEKFNVLSEYGSMSCSQFHEEIRSIGHGFHDGFQRCSVQVKKIEALKTPSDQLFIIRARISGLPSHIENADDFVIHRCLSVMNEVGNSLRKI